MKCSRSLIFIIRFGSDWFWSNCWPQFGGARDGDCTVPRTTVSKELILGSRLVQVYRLDRGSVLLPTRTYLPLSFPCGISIKQPRRPLHLLFLLQILGIVLSIGWDRPRPRCVSTFKCLLPLDLYHSGGSSGYLRKRKGTIGTAPTSFPTSSRRIRTSA